jgi:PAS domain S-box-containing protein
VIPDLKALYPKLIHLLLDTVFVVDEFGQIVFVSDACQPLLGYSADEMTGTRILDYIHPDDLERTVAAANNVMKGQSHTDFRNRYRHKDGSVVHILWSARWSPVERLRIAVARDVTALRQADQTRTALYRISEAAHAAETLRALCDGVREVIGELFPESDLFLAFHDAEKGMLSVPDWSENPESHWTEKPKEAGTAIAEVISTGQALMTSRDPARQGMGLITPPRPEDADWLGGSFGGRRIHGTFDRCPWP